jgi:hypothetical protein
VIFYEHAIKEKELGVKTATTAAEKADYQEDLEFCRAKHAEAVEEFEHHRRVARSYLD